MVKETEKNGQLLYKCEACGFFYKDKQLAEECEAWCSAHGTCNIEITKRAIKDPSS